MSFYGSSVFVIFVNHHEITAFYIIAPLFPVGKAVNV